VTSDGNGLGKAVKVDECFVHEECPALGRCVIPGPVNTTSDMARCACKEGEAQVSSTGLCGEGFLLF
jgi:hypothetical protein